VGVIIAKAFAGMLSMTRTLGGLEGR